MSGSSNGPPVVPVDTQAVTGNVGAAPSGTANRASNVDTAATGGGSRVTEPGPLAHILVDTEAVTGGTNVPVSTLLATTVDTLQPGQTGPGHVDPAYRAPSAPTAGSTKDTTRTDVEPGGSVTNPISASQNVSVTETANIGALGSGTGLTPPVAPTAVTSVTGPRLVTVSWTAPAQIANDNRLGYVVENSAGGHTYAAANATSVAVTNLDPSRTYTFRVAARNKAGLGPFSTASTPAVRPYNPDTADVLKPGGLDPANVVNAIYSPAGVIKAGTGGTNNAPVVGVTTAGAAASKTITVNWTAPTVGAAPTSYVIKASDGITSTTSAAGTTSKAVVFAAAGASVTITVQAINAIGAGVVSAPSTPARVVP